MYVCYHQGFKQTLPKDRAFHGTQGVSTKEFLEFFSMNSHS